MNARWEVNVHGGIGQPDIDKDPLKFGTPQIFVGGDDTRGPEVPLVYGPVALRSAGSWLGMQTLGAMIAPNQYSWNTHREMSFVQDIEFDSFGEVQVSGFEIDPEGRPVVATWTITPYVPPAGNDCLTERENALLELAEQASDYGWWDVDPDHATRVKEMHGTAEVALAVTPDAARFIAACRYAIPELLEVIARLRSQVSR